MTATAKPAVKLVKKPAATAAATPAAEETKAAAPAPAAKPASKVVTKTVAPKTEAPKVEAAESAEAATTVEATDDLIIQTVHEIENMKEAKAFDVVPKLLNNIDHDYFKLGGILSLIQAQGWYMDRGHENFRAYVEAECAIQYRKAMYLISIYNGLVESGVSWDQVKHLGWTKLKELAAILSPENVADWVAQAENMTVLQLQEYIKNLEKGSSTGGDAPPNSGAASDITSMTFKMHKDQKETVRGALDKAKHETGTEVDTVALEHICLDFLGGESKLKAMPTLKELMEGKSAEEVLEIFAEVFPEVAMEVTLP